MDLIAAAGLEGPPSSKPIQHEQGWYALATVPLDALFG